MEIQLKDLVGVSNNSVITNKILIELNDKLSEEGKHNFLKWLGIAKERLNTAESKAVRGLSSGYGFW